MIDLERWKTISRRDQLAHIASEILRAKLANNKNTQMAILERAIDLINFSLADSQWQDNPLMLLYLRNELVKNYIDKVKNLEEILMAI